MFDKKISELPDSDSIGGTELVPLVQGGVTKKVATADLQAATKKYVDDNALDFDSAVFVSTVGDDADDGISPTAPKATFASAITQASALLAAGATRVKVDVLDAGSYTEAGDLTVPSYVSLHAPAATYTGRVFLETFASFDIHTHYASADGQRMLNRTFGGSDAGTAFYKCKVSDGRGAAGTVTGALNVFNQGGVGRNLFVDMELMWVGTNGTGISDTTGGNAGHIHFILADLYLAGAGAVGIRATAAESNIIGYADHILETGSFLNTSAIRVVNAGAEVRVTASGIVADDAYYITGGNLYLSCPRIVGTRTGTPAQLMLGTDDIDTLAELNAIVADATLDDASATRTPTDDSVTVAKLNGTVTGDADDLVALDGAGGFKGIASGAYATPDDLTKTSITAVTADYTAVLGDAGKVIRADSATAMDVTIPTNASVAYPVGTILHVRAAGAGQVTVVAASGVTINTPETLVLKGQWSEASLHYIGSDVWDLVGDVEAAV